MINRSVASYLGKTLDEADLPDGLTVGVSVSLGFYLTPSFDANDFRRMASDPAVAKRVLAAQIRRQVEDMGDEDLADLIEQISLDSANLRDTASDRDIVPVLDKALREQGVKICEDSDQPGMYTWASRARGEFSDVSFPTEIEAKFHALACVEADLSEDLRSLDSSRVDDNPVRVVVETYIDGEDSRPPYAIFELTTELLDRVQSVGRGIKALNISEARQPYGIQWAALPFHDETHTENDQICVTADPLQFIFRAQQKYGGNQYSSSIIDYARARQLLDAAKPGELLFWSEEARMEYESADECDGDDGQPSPPARDVGA